MSGEPNTISIACGFMAGVVIFMLGASLLSESLKDLAGDRMKRIISTCTANRVCGVLSGVVATAALDSSSAVAIIVVGLVHAKVMDLRQAVGVVMGANIGTTVSSQIYALDVVKYGPVLMLAGLPLHWLGGARWRHIGGATLGLGLVFFAMTHLEDVTRPLRGHEPFRDFMKGLENPLLGALAGAIGTAVIQSSSAMVGILIAMVGQGAVSMPVAVAMMLGAEIGTCLDVVVATAGRSREAVRVGLFQLLFNVAGVALFIGFVGPLADLAGRVAGDDPKRQLATAHVLFNVISVAAFAGFAGSIARALEWAIPDAEAAPQAA